jgi:hypothetical protein
MMGVKKLLASLFSSVSLLVSPFAVAGECGVKYVTRQVPCVHTAPCAHVWCGPYGCFTEHAADQLHPFDVITVPVYDCD